jgi:chromosome segregation ATPase
MEDIQLTPELLVFYRAKIRELQRHEYLTLLERLRHVELSAEQRARLEHQVSEYRDELDVTREDLDRLQESLTRERRAVIELVQENAQLRGRLLVQRIDIACCDDVDTPPQTKISSLKRQYETLLKSILADHKDYISRVRQQKQSSNAKINDLTSRCQRLETAILEASRELIKERNQKQALEVRVEEMQTDIERRISLLRSQIDCSVPSDETVRLKAENERLGREMDGMQRRMSVQSSQYQDRMARLELELHRRRQR